MNIIILITLSMPDPSLSGLASMSNSCWLDLTNMPNPTDPH